MFRIIRFFDKGQEPTDLSTHFDGASHVLPEQPVVPDTINTVSCCVPFTDGKTGLVSNNPDNEIPGIRNPASPFHNERWAWTSEACLLKGCCSFCLPQADQEDFRGAKGAI